MKQNVSKSIDGLRLVDENEQLRMQLECALEENARVTEDRDRLLHRVTVMARELHLSSAATGAGLISVVPPDAPYDDDLNTARSETAEELRVAFEELQFLTEELEVANNSLLEFNAQLEDRVNARTREIAHSNAALRRSEVALQTVANVVPDLLWRTDSAGHTEWVNRRWSDFTGKKMEDVVTDGWLSVLHPDDRDAATEAFAYTLMEGASYQREHRILSKSGEHRWFLARIEPLRDDRGKIVQWYGAAMDIHDQRISLDALQVSEVRFRTLIEGMPQLVWRSENEGDWTWSSPQWRALTGQTLDESAGGGWLNAFHPNDHHNIMEAWSHASESGMLAFEGRIYSAHDKRYRHFKTRAALVRGDQDDVSEWLGTSTDVDDILQLRNEQSVLVSELQHRTRNLMAVVQAIMVKTINSSDNMEDFTSRIGERMQALARVQSLLSNRALGTRIPFDRLLREELSAHVALDDPAATSLVTLSGPEDILLRSSTVQTFALALHELTTNAVKYGALSQAGGHLDVRWTTIGDEDKDPWLSVTWRETGVSNVPDPASGAAIRFGYGRELIERALPYQLGARARYAFTPDGIECNIEVKLQ